MDNERRDDRAAQPAKKPYTAPTVEKVPLRPEEAVLGGCKSTSVTGPRGYACRAVGVCSTQGS
jgi:hypothetical protein